MAIMGKKVWAVVCGAIRQEFEFYSVIAWLCEQRANNLIDGIVLSTWIGEVNQINYLRNKLKFLDILIVESAPLEDNIKKNLNLNYSRQAIQLRAALSNIPEDVFVLKCRTDFCMDTLNRLQPLLDGKVDLSIRTYGNFKPNLNYRIAVMDYALSAPFCMGDICYLGYKSDLYKMVIYENTYLKYKDFLAPDCLFFLNIFRNEIPLIDEFLSLVVYWTFKWQLTTKFSVFHDKNIELPGIMNKFYAVYFVLLYCCFYLYRNDTYTGSNDIDIVDIFSCSPSVVTISWITKLKNSDIIDRIIKGNIAQTPFNKKLYAEILKNSAPNYLVTNHFTEQDYIETAEFGKKYFHIEKNIWLKNFTQSNFVKRSYINFDETVKILFPRLPESSNFPKLFCRILTENKLDYYGRIIDNLDELKKFDMQIYEIALLAASRGLNSKTLKEIAVMLYKGQIGEKHKKAAEFTFKRYANGIDFFKWPMDSDKIEALYLYGKYSENLNDDTLSKNFYNYTAQQFKFENDSVSGSYSDALVELIREIVDTKQEDHTQDQSIKCMKEFLNRVQDYIEN